MKKRIITIGIIIGLLITLCGCSNEPSQKSEPTVHSSEYFEEMLSYDNYGNITQRIIINKRTNCSYVYTYYYINDNGYFMLSKTLISTIDETGTITTTENE